MQLCRFMKNIMINGRTDFTKLFNDNYNHLVIYLMRYVYDVDVAKDLAQEVFVMVWEKRLTIHSPVSFLFVCGRNAAYKYLQSNSKTKHLSIDDIERTIPDIDYEELNEYFSRLEHVSDMIEKLPPQCKEVVKQIYFDKRKIAEVAVNMNLSPNTIKTHLKIAKNNLGKFFDLVQVLLLS